MDKKQATISMKVIERFMNAEDLDKFLKSYNASKAMGGGNRDRFGTLERVVTLEERALLKEYFDKEKNTPLREIGEKYGIGANVLLSRIESISRRFIYQNLKNIL